ncbi:hypothetical protein E1176_01820 [Fulvivirga sp. RKSG066]|uniref:hypothetical protein n=1 Tax=Fulvivirga aurantia TaxID=2529383 RepID=UPI0012BC94D2|nr:hypothetical protein [Fulvivirga aurantia]MTI19750.1 hypothetical protein [Fulvivirga aurantia]
MKTIWKYCIGIIVMLSIVACEDDETVNPISKDVEINFSPIKEIAENGEKVPVALVFSEKTAISGQVEVRISSSFEPAFTTSPAAENGLITLDINANTDSVSFFINPVNNDVIDPDRTIDLEIAKVSEGFETGEKHKASLKVLDDDKNEVPANQVKVNFTVSEMTLIENNSQGITVDIALSAPAPQGEIRLFLAGFTENLIVEGHEIVDEEVTLIISKGEMDASFVIKPIYNTKLSGGTNVTISLSSMSEGFLPGTQTYFTLYIKDVELMGKPKSFESVSTSDRYKETYVYNEEGKINYVYWESETPGFRSGTKTYYYSENGLIERINTGVEQDQYFYSEDGRIVRSETFDYGVMKAYSLYDYDEAGNLGGKADYSRQSDGSYKETFVMIYLFDFDHNLYKHLIYVPTAGEDDYDLISTRTYEGYIPGSSNRFPVEIIGTVPMQKRLPGSYRQEENGFNMLFTFSYTTDPTTGQVLSRTATSSYGNQETTYSYY